ncbi:hypothetical protein HOF56_04655 [Candidatus Peribacteria bacterium]|jgi:hypothetical protein|nr:hypothetical protein [Candidatus Peribacteria bacterium]MBT4021502.1 hypothetical protein [Candidatus Peribacteria bacterium]MBT4240412.1 hypothetical protein [Candidatus Peribacteria bacterium]MBT4473835.1 hypothetical protein [Candidatus Peribacteria bacterium]
MEARTDTDSNGLLLTPIARQAALKITQDFRERLISIETDDKNESDDE